MSKARRAGGAALIIDIVAGVPIRGWHQRLTAELRASGHRVRLVADPRPVGSGLGASAGLAIQQRLFGPKPSLFDVAVTRDESGGEEAADLVVALDGRIAKAKTVLVPLFDGRPGDRALIDMITSGRSPRVRIAARRDGACTDIVCAVLAIEERTILSRALHQVLARLVTLITQAVRRAEQDQQALPSGPCSETSTRSSTSPLAHMSRGLLQKLSARVTRPRHGDHWRIGLRPLRYEAAPTTGSWADGGFDILPDDGSRFLADPMPFEHEGRLCLFFEEFPYATRKGVIGLVEIGPAGVVSPPRTVLEQPVHLSYPYVIRHGGAIYMLPEMSGAGRIQLFRADPFPDAWVPDRVLVGDIAAADATPVFHDGRWWMFATVSTDGGSSWDQLHLFHAPDLLGPWVPHADNPVLVDAGAARPAGAMWHEDGYLMRVAQDCRRGYGDGLAICRIDRLDAQGYAQTVVARLGVPDIVGAEGVHTLNRAGGFEVVDLRFPSAAPLEHPRSAVPRALGRG